MLQLHFLINADRLCLRAHISDDVSNSDVYKRWDFSAWILVQTPVGYHAFSCTVGQAPEINRLYSRHHQWGKNLQIGHFDRVEGGRGGGTGEEEMKLE